MADAPQKSMEDIAYERRLAREQEYDRRCQARQEKLARMLEGDANLDLSDAFDFVTEDELEETKSKVREHAETGLTAILAKHAHIRPPGK